MIRRDLEGIKEMLVLGVSHKGGNHGHRGGKERVLPRRICGVERAKEEKQKSDFLVVPCGLEQEGNQGFR